MINCPLAFIQSLNVTPWLIVGKGPSLDECPPPYPTYHTVTLNHACDRMRPTIAHFIDMEAITACEHILAASIGSAMRICLPWRPHVNHKPGKALDEVKLPGFLKLYSEAGKLLAYNSTLSVRQPYHQLLPWIRVRYFSAVAAFNLIAAAGIKHIDTVGVDGGTEYARGFDVQDRLANGRASFNDQFIEIDKTVRNSCIQHQRLTIQKKKRK